MTGKRRHWNEAPQINWQILDHFMRGGGSRGQRLLVTDTSWRGAISFRQQVYRWFERLRDLQQDILADKADALEDERKFRKLMQAESSDWRVTPYAVNKIRARILDAETGEGLNNQAGTAKEREVIVEFSRKPEWSIGEDHALEQAEPAIISMQSIVAIARPQIPPAPQALPPVPEQPPGPGRPAASKEIPIDVLANFLRDRVDGPSKKKSDKPRK